MKKLLILSTALTGLAFAAHADVTVMSWGGAYGAAQTEAHLKPFTAATGIATVMVDSDNPATPIKAMVEAGNVTVDVASRRICRRDPPVRRRPAGADRHQRAARRCRWHPGRGRLPAGRRDRMRRVDRHLVERLRL